MLTLSATCLAIALADQSGALRFVERPSRLGGTYIAIEDSRGIIEVADDLASAHERVAQIRERVA